MPLIRCRNRITPFRCGGYVCKPKRYLHAVRLGVIWERNDALSISLRDRGRTQGPRISQAAMSGCEDTLRCVRLCRPSIISLTNLVVGLLVGRSTDLRVSCCVVSLIDHNALAFPQCQNSSGSLHPNSVHCTAFCCHRAF